MIRTDEELAAKIVYLKENNYMPDIDNESIDVQRIICSFCSKSAASANEANDDFWFRISFCNYMVSDEFVQEVNRAYKKVLIQNIGKDEFN